MLHAKIKINDKVGRMFNKLSIKTPLKFQRCFFSLRLLSDTDKRKEDVSIYRAFSFKEKNVILC